MPTVSLTRHPRGIIEHMSEYERRAARAQRRFIRPEDCETCGGAEYVCVNHPDRPWGALSEADNACRCGKGLKCPTCGVPFDPRRIQAR